MLVAAGVYRGDSTPSTGTTFTASNGPDPDPGDLWSDTASGKLKRCVSVNPVVWEVLADVGPQGPQGPQGVPGATGATGPQGPQGPPGQDATLSSVYPVGSIYISAVSTNPNTLFGMGTWVAIGTGRVLVGIDAGDADFSTPGGTGGAKTNVPSAHSGTAVGVSGAGGSHNHSHSHAAGTLASPTTGASSGHTHAHTHGVGTLAGPSHSHSHTHDNHGFTQPSAHSNHAALATHSHELPFQIPTTTTTRQIAAATFGTGTSRAATAVSAAGTANTTSAAVALTQAVSGGTPDAHSAHAGGAVSPVTHAADATLGGTGAITGATASDTSAESGHTHPGGAITGTSGTDATAEAAHTHPAGTVTQPANHTALSVVQPYLVVYMWQRTA